MVETGLLDTKLTLCRGFQVWAPTPGEVQLRSGLMAGQAVAFADPGRRGQLAEVLGQLDGTRTVGEVLREWPETSRRLVLKTLGLLVARGILVESSDDPSSWIRQGLAPFQGKLGPESLEPESLETAEVALVGAGVLGSRVAVNLVLMGVRRLSVWDPTPLSLGDRALSPAHLDGVQQAPRAASLAAYLARLAPTVQVSVGEKPEPPPKALLMVALDRIEPSVLHRLNAEMMQRQSPWLLSAMDGSTGMVGPLIVPGQTGCYQCLESSWIARSRKPEQLRPVMEALREGATKAAFYGFPGFADAVAGLLTADLPNLLRNAAGLTLGQILSVDFVTLSATTYPLLKLPRCPACGFPEAPGGGALNQPSG